MRAYLAILKDSWREAAASMVLWLALGGILLLLLALFPIGLMTAENTELRHQELVDTDGMLKALYENRADPETPEGHIWSLLTAEQQEQLTAYITPDREDDGRRGRPGRGKRSTVVDMINELLKKNEFYDPVAFEKVELDEELRMPNADTLTASELSNRNLRRLEKVFASSISVSERSALSLSYAGFDLTGPLPILPSQMKKTVDGIITIVLGFFLGIVGVFASLLFTAPLIPRTFEPGEISLLLSKPIYRSMLYLTKFFGGCVFTLMCAALLVMGIWLLLGTRLEMWRPELMWCIPLYVFLFAIYFSVSALAGAIWRNAVVSLILVLVFWLGVTLIGVAQNSMNEFIVKARRVSEISANGGEVFAVDGGRLVYRWNAELVDWDPVAQAGSADQIPAFLQRIVFSGHRLRISVSADGQRIVALQPSMNRIGRPGPANIVSGTADEKFELQTDSQPPESMLGIYQTAEGNVLLPGPRGIYKFVGQTEQERKTQVFIKGLFGGLLPASSGKAFAKLTDKSFPALAGGSSVAFNPQDESFLVLNNGEIRRINKLADGQYAAGESKNLNWNDSALLAAGGSIAIISRGDGRTFVVDAVTFETLAEAALPSGEKPRVVECAPDGSSAAVLTHNGIIRVFDTASRSFLSWVPQENGSASAMTYDEESHLLVVDRHRSVRVYDISAKESVKQLPGSVDLPCLIYDYLVAPIYAALPKPRDLDHAVEWIVTGEKSAPLNRDGNPGIDEQASLEAERVTFQVRNSILSNLAFISVLLAAGCWYVARSDF